MASSSFVVSLCVAGLSVFALVACTSALGTFTIDNTLDGGSGGGREGGSTLADGATTTDSGTAADAGVVEGGGKDGCNGGDGRYVFVTSATFEGNFGGVTPIVAANTICKDAAKSGGKLPVGNYNAWLSTVAGSPGMLNSPLFLPDCTMVITDPAMYQKSQGNLEHPINQDESGKIIQDGPAWTATSWNGSYAGAGSTPLQSDCSGWNDNGSATQAKGIVGNIGAADDKWTDAMNVPCNTRAHIICYQTK